jgi:uncharacterized phage protein (TIGR02218 family)
MRTDIPPALQTHLETRETTLAWCWRITRLDGVVLGFTNHDRTLSFDSTDFEASTGFLGTEIESQLGMTVDNMDVYGAVDSVKIIESDIEAGLFDGAEIEVFLVNWEPAVSNRVFSWSDVFTDHTDSGGSDWSGYGSSELLPVDEPLQWFIQVYLRTINPGPATISLESPTGKIYVTDRIDFDAAKDLILDFGDNEVLRGRADTFWGLLYMWGIEVASGSPIRVQGASIGDTEIILDSPASISPGDILELRTDATAPDYHPYENRDTLIVLSVDGNTLTLANPLTIDVPYENPLNYTGEDFDPSTVTRLVGGILTTDANAGDLAISLSNAEGIKKGDWLRIATVEIPAYHRSQFTDLDDQMNPLEEFGNIPMNEELIQVAAVGAGFITLARPLEKNKLTAWSAHAHKIDPCHNVHIMGGEWKGIEDQGNEDPWKHQYAWGRYCVGCSVSNAEFDTDPGVPLPYRRMGQAVRFDTGYMNAARGLTIGRGAGIDAGQSYGVSLRRGEAYSEVHHCSFTQCRHSVELWSTSGGCVVRDNEAINGTSSDFDTHGSWNVGAIIRDNYGTNNGLLLSPDLGGSPDFLRAGNNKFMRDIGILFKDNVCENYAGNAISVVPGTTDVVVDGLYCVNIDQIFGLTKNTRHPNMKAERITVRNVLAEGVTDRLSEVSHSGGNVVVEGLTLEGWDVGVNGIDGLANTATAAFRVLNAVDVVLDKLRLDNIYTPTFGYGFSIRNCNGVEATDCWQVGGERLLDIRDTLGFSGTFEAHNLTATTPYTVREQGVCSGSVTVEYGGFSPASSIIALSYTQTSITSAPDRSSPLTPLPGPDAYVSENPQVSTLDYSQRVMMKKGTLGEVKRGRTMFQTEVRGISSQLQQVKGRVYQYSCDALLGDSRCAKAGLSGPSFTGTGTVADTNGYSSLSATGLGSYSNNWFTRGKITFTSGLNNGVAREIKSHFNTDGVTSFSLWEPLPFEMSPGDTFTIRAGCDKTFKMCKAKFANANNFRGFPHIPGGDTVRSYANIGDPNFDGGGNFVNKD